MNKDKLNKIQDASSLLAMKIESEGMEYAILEYSDDLVELDPAFAILVKEFNRVYEAIRNHLDIE